MNQDVRDILNKIDDTLSKNDQSSNQLWDVLTSLRGPDNEDSYLKAATTLLVRSAAFPKTASVAFVNDTDGIAGVHGALYGTDNDYNTRLRRASQQCVSEHLHFYHHVHTAFIALSLLWEENNNVAIQ